MDSGNTIALNRHRIAIVALLRLVFDASPQKNDSFDSILEANRYSLKVEKGELAGTGAPVLGTAYFLCMNCACFLFGIESARAHSATGIDFDEMSLRF